MDIKNFCDIMQGIAPLELAADFDNAGLITDGDGGEIKKVLVALDCSDAVANEAVVGGYDLVLTHHPLLFHSVKKLLRTEAETSALYTLIRHGIALYSAHTNLDIAEGGVNDVLCHMFDLRDCVKVEPENYGRVGNLEKKMSLTDFVKLADKLLCTRSKCAVANYRKDPENIMVKRVAVMGGSGGDDVPYMKEYGADVYVTGEIKHDKAIAAQHIGVSVVAAGHYETERVVLGKIISSLQTCGDDVQYNLSQCELSPLRLI